MEPFLRNTENASEFEQRVHETGADSRVGETLAADGVHFAGLPAFTSLAYLMDIDWLKEAYRRTRKDGAVGVDGVTADQYEQDLEGNLQRLLDRAKSDTYRAPPCDVCTFRRAARVPKTRPLGIPTLEDKVLQRAVVMLLEPVYEQGLSGLLLRFSGRGHRHTRRWDPSGHS